MLESNVTILIGVILLAVVFYNLYNSVMKTEKNIGGKDLQITPEEIFEQVETLLAKGNSEVAHQLAKKYLNANPNHDLLRVILAKSLYKQGKYLDSIQHFEKITKSMPERDDLWELLAIAYKKVGQRINAINAYLELLKLTPDSIDAKLFLAELYDETHQKKMALNLYKKIYNELDSDNDRVHCLLNMSKICRDMVDMDEAVRYAQAVLAIRQDYPQALHLLKELYRTMGRDADVIEIMNKLLSQTPENCTMQLELVNFYYNNKRFDEALDIAQKALDVTGADRVSLNCIIAKVFIAKDSPQLAVETLKNALEAYPNNTEIIELLASSYIKMSDYESAIQLYEKLTELSGIEEAKSQRNCLCNLYCDWAMSLFKKDKVHEAFEKLNLALEINPDNICIYKNLGRMSLLSKDFNEAIKYFKRAIDIQPHDCESYVLLGDAYLEMDDTYNAEKAYQEAIYIAPEDPGARCKMGIIRIRQRNVTNALEHLKMAVDKEPDNENYLYNLALGYEFAGDVENAVKTYERVLQVNPNHAETINNMKILKNSN